jgi:glyoxylase-like metal-dependent hydrolase (beta-lactamase superfamily II)
VSQAAATGSRQHDAWRRRELPEVEEVRDGLWSLPVVIPDSPLRYVLVYALRLDDGLALIDAGWPHDESWDGLVAGIAQTGHDVADVRTVLLTHSHSDHHGLTARVRQASGASVGMHPAEAAVLAARAGGEGLAALNLEWLRCRGAPRQDIELLTSEMRGMLHMALELASPDFVVEHGVRPLAGRQDVRAIWTPGHTPGHLCFMVEDDQVLLTGDHVLPRITPNVSRGPIDRDDAVGDYLESLRSIAKETATEVLPAHEYRFDHLQDRIADMLDHHAHRLFEIERTVEAQPGATTWEIASTISWSRGWDSTAGMMRQTAVSETYTHLVHLERSARLRRGRDHVDHWEPA